MRSRGALALIPFVVALAAGSASPVAAFASSKPASKPAAKPVPRQHFRVPPLDGTVARQPQRRTARPATLSNPVIGGSWTALGPAPVADEKNCCTPPSDYGKAAGRVTSLVTDPNNPSIIYLGAAGGGVWKSTDAGATWSTTTDSQPSIAIGSLAIDAAGTTIYAGTGEDNASGDSQLGHGILKSTDSGSTWSVVGQSIFAYARIGGMVVDRTTTGATERVFAATNQGLFKSADAGATWALVPLPVSVIPGNTGSQRVMQVLQDSTGRFWAAVSDFCQTERGDVMTSPDGSTWTTSISGGSWGRVGLGISKDGTVAYAALASCSNFGDLIGIEKNSNAGAPGFWTLTAAPPAYFSFSNVSPSQSQGWYDNVVAVDPTNPNNAVFGGITAIGTPDGGAHFTDIALPYSGGVIHPDFHALLYTAANTLYAGNDGGIWQGQETLVSPSVSASWKNLNANLDTVQFYQGVALDMSHLLGGSQDNGTAGILPNSPATAPSWQEYLDGDGGYTAIDPTPGSTVIYASSATGGIWRGSSAPTGSAKWPYDTFQEADPCPQGSTLPVCSEPTAFTAPFLMDATNPSRLLAATTTVYQSTTGGIPAGGSWSAISPVLATAAPPAGAFDYIASMTMGPTGTTVNTVMTGSFFGAAWMTPNTDNGPAGWANITGNLPAFNLINHVPGDAWISGVAFNPDNTQEAWVTIGALGVGHVWHTMDARPGGATWTDVSGSAGAGVPDVVVNGIIFSNGSIYIATDSGVMACATCGGANAAPAWSILGVGLPNAKVNAITLTAAANRIVAWTHGRGAWVIPIAVLQVTPSALTFTVGDAGAQPAAQPLTPSNQGFGTLTWAQTSSASWLSATPPMGTDGPGASSQVTVSVNTAGLAAGTHNGTLSFTSNGGSANRTVTLVIPNPGPYQPVVPARILDTRDGTGGYSSAIGGNQTIAVQVAGQGGVPAMNSATPPAAVVLNVTVTNPTAWSHLTVYPTGVLRPTASNLNFVAGQTVPNLVEVALGPDGKVNIYNLVGTVDVIFDVEGWVATLGTVPGPAGRFRPLVPARILDTRTGTGGFSAPLGANQAIHLQVSGQGGVPGLTSATPPEAVVMNVTVTNPTAWSHLIVYPTGVGRPTASNLNFISGQTVPNRVEVKLGVYGQVDIYNLFGSVDVIVDVNGWFSDGSGPAASGGLFNGLTPARLLDSRTATGGHPLALGPGGSLLLQVAGQGGVPSTSAPVPPTAVVLNVTVTNTSVPSHLIVYPSDAGRPQTSDLNWRAGLTAPNLVVVKLGADGNLGMFNYSGSTDVVVDVFGWYQ